MSHLQKLRDKHRLFSTKYVVEDVCEAILKDAIFLEGDWIKSEDGTEFKLTSREAEIVNYGIKQLLQTPQRDGEGVYTLNHQSPEDKSVTHRKAHKQELGEEMSYPEDTEEDLK